MSFPATFVAFYCHCLSFTLICVFFPRRLHICEASVLCDGCFFLGLFWALTSRLAPPLLTASTFGDSLALDNSCARCVVSSLAFLMGVHR